MPVVSVQGTVRVVCTVMVVTGYVCVAVADTLDAQVMMAGLEGMCGAQMPWK